MAVKTRPCAICGLAIDPERIEVLTETELCGDHARAIGKYGGEFIVTGKQASLGKTSSLKKNYGDVSIEKQRNTRGIERLRQEWQESNPPTHG